ncbi:MAG: hypothetical protein EOR04_11440 [Mesorhizobium sp.]|uniref:hypothetical protein n=1 Tax=Mesorhizobium sp. TaxID=1871066 RepID=UPI000FE71C3D|nr:hypothetical protein [Mesorhizobium sp.]RWP42423.1 MAG: hypothetical protein EOR04_11440 [Mesorhizobium sp.]
MSLRMIKDVLKPTDIKTNCAACGRSFARFPSDEEHIFPKWLQHHHNLWTRKLNVPNYIGKHYKSVKIRLCKRCNGTTYHSLETMLAPLLTSTDPFTAVSDVSDDALATWLGKIMWLLVSLSRSAIDYRTRDLTQPDSILPANLVPGTLFLGMLQRAFATGKSVRSCFLHDPPAPTLYGNPFSLYRFRIDTSDDRFEAFDFSDNPAALGVALRSGNLGVVCVFDGGLHREFIHSTYEFLANELLHPQQFSEVAARMFYDQTVLDDRAARVTYFWNEPLRAVIAQTHVPRFYNPYLEANHDNKRLAQFIGSQTSTNPSQILLTDGVVTSLMGPDGKFGRFLATDAELEVARKDPTRIVMGPLDANWRITEDGR